MSDTPPAAVGALRHVPNKKNPRRLLTGYDIVREPSREFPQVGVDTSSDTGDDGDDDDDVTGEGKTHFGKAAVNDCFGDVSGG